MSFVATWVDVAIIILSEVNQTEKDKYHMISFTCGKKNNKNELFHKQKPDSQTQKTNLWLSKGKVWGAG